MGQYQIPYNKSSPTINMPNTDVVYFIDLKSSAIEEDNQQFLERAVQNSEDGTKLALHGKT